MVFLTDRLHLAAWAATSSVLYLFHLPFSSQHLAFKGTSEIGSRDWRREEPLLKSLDEAFYELRDARDEERASILESGLSSASPMDTDVVSLREGPPPPGLRVRRLQEQFESVQAEALQLTVPNAFGAALQNEGGSGLNANTSQDQTK